MRVKLIGEPFGRQLRPGDEFRVLSQDFIMVRADGFVVVMPKWDGGSGGKYNGASIPWLFQCLPRMGSAFEGKNPWWSCHHDGGYQGEGGGALVFDLCGMSFEDMCWLAERWRVELAGMYKPRKWPRRKWWDKGMKACMACDQINEPPVKRWLAYRAVRVGGWLPWRKARRG